MSKNLIFVLNGVRSYARWVARRPAKVLEPKHLKAFDELGKVEIEHYAEASKSEEKFMNESSHKPNKIQSYDDNVTVLKHEDVKRIHKKSSLDDTKRAQSPQEDGNTIVKNTSKKRESKTINIKENFIIVDEATNFEYEKLKMGDPKFSTIMNSVKSRKKRQQTNQILVEGRRLIRDALLANMKLHTLMFSKTEHLTYLSEWLKIYERDANCMFYKVPHGDMTVWSDLTTNPGIMALFSRPSQYYIPHDTKTPAVPITVVCDNIREPSNLGSIIRTCAALPCHQLILIKGCVDPWDSKVLRSGSGGHFRLTLLDDIIWTNLKEHLPENCQVFIADATTHKGKINLPIQNYDKASFCNSKEENEKHNVIIIGGETEGISLDAYQFANFFNGQRLHIPIAHGVDSLNSAIALSILTFEIRRQLLK